MKVLQIKCVVTYLIDRVAGELIFTNLELDDEEDRINQQDYVRTPTHSRNGEFEVDLSLHSRKLLLQYLNLDLPRRTLGLLYGKLVGGQE